MLQLLRSRSRGQAMVEYAIILALAIVVVIVVLTLLGNQVHDMYNNITCGVGNPGGSCVVHHDD